MTSRKRKKGETDSMPQTYADVEKSINEYLDVNTTVEKLTELHSKYPELTPREHDFAQRYALEGGEISKYAKMYGITMQAIHRWLKKPRVIQFIEEIRHDARAHYFSTILDLGHDALSVYREVLRTPITNRNRSDIVATANRVTDILNKSLIPGMGSSTPGSQFNVNLNQNNQTAFKIEVVGVAPTTQEDTGVTTTVIAEGEVVDEDSRS